jgi:hypothetical protein
MIVLFFGAYRVTKALKYEKITKSTNANASPQGATSGLIFFS